MIHPRRLNSGFTLIEMTIALAVLGILIWIAGMVTSTSRALFEGSSLKQKAENEARRALDRAVSELAAIGEAVMFPEPGAVGTDRLDFQQAAGVQTAGPNAGDPAWGPPMRLELEIEPTDPDNGVDDDGDGSIDERVLVLTRNVGLANERRVVLCDHVRELLEGEADNAADDNGNGLVNEPGFVITRAGDVLTLRLSLEERGRDDEGAVATVETSTRLRIKSP